MVARGSAVNDPLSNANRGADWIRRPVPQLDASRPTHVGSGFLIDNKGTILTAFHVVEHAEEIHVRTHEGHEFLATAIMTDPQSDIALLRIPAAGFDNGLMPRLRYSVATISWKWTGRVSAFSPRRLVLPMTWPPRMPPPVSNAPLTCGQ